MPVLTMHDIVQPSEIKSGLCVCVSHFLVVSKGALVAALVPEERATMPLCI